MQIEGSADAKVVERIEAVVKEHYDDTLATLISINTTHVLDDRIYIVQTVSAWEGDDEYTIHTETVRVDRVPLQQTEGFVHTFTLLSENDLDLIEEL